MYLSLGEVLELQRLILVRPGGSAGERDAENLDSALTRPATSFGGQEIYASLPEKAAVLNFASISSQSFVVRKPLNVCEGILCF